MICEQIKLLVEEYGGVEDLSVKTRTRHLSDLRFTYYKLCTMLTDDSLVTIGKHVNRDHTTVIHGLKMFKQWHEDGVVDFMPYYAIYKAIYQLLKPELVGKTDFKDVKSLVQFYRLKHIRLVKKSHKVIRKLQNRINELTKQNNENTTRTNTESLN